MTFRLRSKNEIVRSGRKNIQIVEAVYAKVMSGGRSWLGRMAWRGQEEKQTRRGTIAAVQARDTSDWTRVVAAEIQGRC